MIFYINYFKIKDILLCELLTSDLKFKFYFIFCNLNVPNKIQFVTPLHIFVNLTWKVTVKF